MLILENTVICGYIRRSADMVEIFKKVSRAYQVSAKGNPDIGRKDYLLYWFEDVFSERIENTTRMVCAYVLYDLMLLAENDLSNIRWHDLCRTAGDCDRCNGIFSEAGWKRTKVRFSSIQI